MYKSLSRPVGHRVGGRVDGQNRPVRVRPVSPERLISELAERIAGTRSGSWLRVAIDGAPAAQPDEWADALVEPLRVRGRPVVRVRTTDYLRPASLRLEFGRESPDAFYEDWLDAAGLAREALDPLAPAGTGRVRPQRWDAATDRASRTGFVDLPRGGVLLLSGELLLGRGLDLDLTVHCAVSAAALERRTPARWRWTLPAYERYAAEVDPAGIADVVVRLDDLRHPALVDP